MITLFLRTFVTLYTKQNIKQIQFIIYGLSLNLIINLTEQTIWALKKLIYDFYNYVFSENVCYFIHKTKHKTNSLYNIRVKFKFNYKLN
jgi:hypothetical protein